MTVYRGVQNTLAQKGPSFAPISSGYGGGKPAFFYDYYTIPASGFADGDSIEMGPDYALKKGDTFMGYSLWHEAMGASVVAAVGDDGSATRYGSAHDVAALATTPKTLNVFTGFGYVLTQDRPLRLRLSGAAPTAAKTVRIEWRVLRP
jgi:hypothetical protein